MTAPALRDNGRSLAITLNKVVYQFSQHWFLSITVLLAIFIGLPWFAPVFMALGWTKAGEAIYLIYSTQCHQLPQRSFFLFGDQMMLPFSTIKSLGADTSNPLVLRQFIGEADVGWKVAWSDRMVYMYTSLFISGLVFWSLRKRIKPLPWWGVLLFLLPMAIDGITHFISDALGGIGSGFRFSNDWLATLTGNTFPATFYIGDALGSFNSWMRLISGLFFGIGVVWFLYPLLQTSFKESVDQIEAKFQQAAAKLEHNN